MDFIELKNWLFWILVSFISIKLLYDIGVDIYLNKKYKVPFDYYSWLVLGVMIFISTQRIIVRSGVGGNIYLLILAIPLLFVLLRKRNKWRDSQIEVPQNKDIERVAIINLYVLLGFVALTFIALAFMLTRIK